MTIHEARLPSELEGHAIIVTGGTRGIGHGIVRLLAQAGAKLAVTGRKAEGLERVAAELDELQDRERLESEPPPVPVHGMLEQRLEMRRLVQAWGTSSWV